ncbi:MAG: MFS transporter [Spirochaetes bacterium]|nr:MFS transporter [Spirochaetota bacterium]
MSQSNSIGYKKIILLLLLYFSQGLPFGFQATALPVYLRSCGVSLTAIGLAGFAAAPWMLKALWAPFVDRYYIPDFGRRKSWIVPMQILLFISILVASAISPKENIMLLMIAVFFMNLFAATQDIAVDGLAVDILESRDLGPGNAAQVVGYKAGMLVSGGFLLWLNEYVGWRGLFIVMAALSFLPLVGILLYKEVADRDAIAKLQRSLKDVLNIVVKAFTLPGAVWLIAFIATYKFGELMIDVMFKPFLVDSGFSASQIGLWVGTYGMAASLLGSICGGALSARIPLWKALGIASVLRVIPLCLEWWLTLIKPAGFHVISVTLAEHFFGGILTTAVFAFMMSRVDKRIGATHYTILASIEVLGKTPGAGASGFIADKFGYQPLFAAGVILSVLVIAIIPKLKDKQSPDFFH